MDNQRIIISGIVGGLIAAILNSVPFLNLINCFCCIGIMFGGAVALYYYDRTFEFPEYINLPNSVTVGIAAGILGAFISLIIEWIIYINFGHWELEFLKELTYKMDEVPPIIDEVINELENESHRGFLFGQIMLRNLIVMPIFCLSGSLITRVFLNKNRVEEI